VSAPAPNQISQSARAGASERRQSQDASSASGAAETSGPAGLATSGPQISRARKALACLATMLRAPYTRLVFLHAGGMPALAALLAASSAELNAEGAPGINSIRYPFNRHARCCIALGAVYIKRALGHTFWVDLRNALRFKETAFQSA
jgi:hypothetical protein